MESMAPPSAGRGPAGCKIRVILAALALTALAAGPLGLCATAHAAAQPPTSGVVRVGDFAPTFTLKTLAGEPWALADHLGKRPVLLLFWSFFCFPCQRELPELDALARQIGAENLTVLGVGLDGPEYDERVVPFLRDKGITLPMVHDKETEEYFETAERYGVVGTPTFFLIDLQGRIRLIQLGRVEPEMLVSAVKAAREQSYCPEITKPPARPAR